MAEEIQKAAEEHFRSLTEAERRMLLAEKSTRAICGNDDCDSNPTNNPECGELWCETRCIRADVIAWLCKNAGAYSRSASDGIHIYGARITGVLDLSYEDVRLPLVFMRCYFNDEIWLKNANILSLNLTGSKTHRIMADGLQVANHIFFGDGFHAKGEVLFRDATIGGSFNAVGATFEYEPSERSRANSFNSLGCDRIKIDGSMFLRRSSFNGEVGLAGANIGSNLDCDGSTLENPFAAQDGSRFAIRADRITVSGSVFLRSQFSSKGSIRLLSGKIGTLDCTQATIEGDGRNGFNAEGAAIVGQAVFDNFAIQNGGIEFRGLTADDVSFRGAKLTTVDLRYASIRRALRLKQIVDTNQSLWDLRNASVGSVDDDEKSWPQPGRLFINGFTYQGFGSASAELQDDSSKAPLDLKSRKRWVELDTSCPPHAYNQLASTYSRMGDTPKARAILFALEELLHCNGIKEEKSSFVRLIRRAWKFLLNITIGYGYKLDRAGWWMALFLLVGFILSYVGYSAHLIVPTEKDAYAFFTQSQHWFPPNGYPSFHATMFSIENEIPAINLSTSDYWRAIGSLSWWFYGQKIIGWFLSIFFVAGITGLTKSGK